MFNVKSRANWNNTPCLNLNSGCLTQAFVFYLPLSWICGTGVVGQSFSSCMLFHFLFVFFSCVIDWGKMSYIGVRLHNSWPAFPTTLLYFVERMKSCCWRGEVGKQGASISHATKIELLGAWCPCLHSDGSAVLLALLLACVCVLDRDEGLLQCSLYSLDVCILP